MPALPCALCTECDATVRYEASEPLVELLSEDSRLDVAGSPIAIPLCEGCHDRLTGTLETLDGSGRSSKSIAEEELRRYARDLSISIINDASH